MFLNIVRSENGNAQYYKDLIFSLQSELWFSKRQSLIENIKNNYSSIYKNYHDITLFKSNSTLFKSLIKSLCEVCLIAMVAVLIIKTESLSIGKLTFVISAFALLRNSITDFFGYFLTKIDFDVYWQVYKDITTVSQPKTNSTFNIESKLRSICFKIQNQVYSFDTNKNNSSTMSVMDLFSQADQILLNDKTQSLTQQFLSSLIIINQETKCDSSILMNQISKEPLYYSQYIQYFHLDLNKQTQGFYKSLIINLLSLLHEKDKIIFLDDVAHFIYEKDKRVFKQIINHIKKYNSVFIVGKEEND